MKFPLLSIACLACICARAFAQDVSVECVDSSTKTVFDISTMPASALPAKFAVNNVLAIKGVKWIVLAADPAAKDDFVKAGKVTLVLARADKMYPGGSMNTIFRVPSMSGGIGRVSGTTPPGPDILAIHEDDWRQVEFVSTSQEKEIDAEFADIHKIRVDDRKGDGFGDLHIRERVTDPVSGLTLRDLAELLTPVRKFQAVGFYREPGTLPGSFAWAIGPAMILWGLADNEGNITQLCLLGAPRKEDTAALSAALAKLTLRYDLYLVDWCREIRIEGDIPGFENYFGGQ